MDGSFKQFLIDRFGYTPSTAEELFGFGKRNEKLLLAEKCFIGQTLDDIVANDNMMGAALSLIPGYYRSKQTAHQNALRLYYYYFNGYWFDAWPFKQTRTKRAPKVGTASCRIPSFIPGYSSPSESERFPVFYAENVAETEKLPGLINFVLEEYSQILRFYQTLNSEFGHLTCGDLPAIRQLPRIPVILRKECPTEDYRESDEWIAQKIADLVQQKNRAVSEADILEVLKMKNHTERICGIYYHRGCPASVLIDANSRSSEVFYFHDESVPYIEIFYRNTECTDSEEYTAFIGNCLAHEYCHFLHDWYAGAEFSANTPACKAVTEGVADFCSVAYTLNRATYFGKSSATLISFAEKKYENWMRWFGSSWPYANALYFYLINGAFLPFSPQIMRDQIDKLLHVLYICVGGMDDAYQEMIP